MERYDGKVVLITGAGRGAGRVLAEAFARQGAQVAANDISPVNLDVTIENIRHAGGNVQEYIADVGKQMPVESMIDQVQSAWGRIDVLINAAGVWPRSALFATDEWDWRRTIDVNLCGPFFTMQIVGRIMQRLGGGSILNFAVALAEPGLSCPEGANAAFLASKMGLVGLTQQAAREFAPDNIRVNAICPACTEPGEHRTAQLQKIAELALYLCSPAAAHITGQIFSVPSIAATG